MNTVLILESSELPIFYVNSQSVINKKQTSSLISLVVNQFK